MYIVILRKAGVIHMLRNCKNALEAKEFVIRYDEKVGVLRYSRHTKYVARTSVGGPFATYQSEQERNNATPVGCVWGRRSTHVNNSK